VPTPDATVSTTPDSFLLPVLLLFAIGGPSLGPNEPNGSEARLEPT
jgi:hypothetical protein